MRNVKQALIELDMEYGYIVEEAIINADGDTIDVDYIEALRDYAHNILQILPTWSEV